MITYALAAVLIALLVVDWLQTRYIAKHPERFAEMNIVLGKHPSVAAVNTYFTACVVVVAGLAYLLPEPYGAIGCCLLAAFELFITVRNYRFGVRFA